MPSQVIFCAAIRPRPHPRRADCDRSASTCRMPPQWRWDQRQKGCRPGPFIKAGKALFCNHGACAKQKATGVLRGYGWSGLKRHISGEDSPRHRAAAQEELTTAKRQKLTNLLDPAGNPIEGWLVGTIVAAEDAVQPPPSVLRKRAAAPKEVEVSHAITDCFIGRNCQSIFLGNTGCWPRTQHDQA